MIASIAFLSGDSLYVNWHRSCQAWGAFEYQNIKVVNNVWGGNYHDEYTQCIYQNKNNQKNMAWLWSWNTAIAGVKAYPSLIYGQKPWYKRSTTKELPVQLSQLQSLVVDFSVMSYHSGSANLLLEAWLTDNNNPQPTDRTSEVAIHLYQQNWPGQGGDLVDTINIDGRNYNVYLNHKMQVPNDSHTWSYISFVNSDDPIQVASINFKKFLEYALTNKMILPSEYLSSLELGNEIDHGAGHFLVKDFTVKIK